jgi:hypothetical protein
MKGEKTPRKRKRKDILTHGGLGLKASPQCAKKRKRKRKQCAATIPAVWT